MENCDLEKKFQGEICLHDDNKQKITQLFGLAYQNYFGLAYQNYQS